MPKGPKGEKRPGDANQLAKLIVGIATGEKTAKDEKPTLRNKTRKKRVRSSDRP
jgi:hypothetical protein